VHPGVRFTLAMVRPTGDVLVSDGEVLYLWTPRTGRERALKVPAMAGAHILSASISYDGSFAVVHTGLMGQHIWKVPLAAPAQATRFHVVEQGESMDGGVVMEDGTILVSPKAWTGELVAIDGRFE
jgi:hypothetical protein